MWFERAQAEMSKRRHSEEPKRRSKQERFYLLCSFLQCATGHDPLRMHGKIRVERLDVQHQLVEAEARL
jgi:hypothetical protein